LSLSSSVLPLLQGQSMSKTMTGVAQEADL
jgi:hypothetical protein